MLEKIITFNHLITEDGIIQVRRIERINGLSDSYRHHTVTPLDNVANEDDRTKLIVGAIYTPEFVKMYKKKMKEQEAELKNK